MRSMARKAKPFRLHCGKIPYETLTSPGLTSRAMFTSIKPINRLLAQSNTPKARRGPPVRQLSWLFRMNASTVNSVLRPPLTHFHLLVFTGEMVGCILRRQGAQENYSIRQFWGVRQVHAQLISLARQRATQLQSGTGRRRLIYTDA